MKKEEYMEIGKKFWMMNSTIINFCGTPEIIHQPVKGIAFKGLCLGLIKYNENIRKKLFREYLKDFPKDENNPFIKGGWSMFQQNCNNLQMEYKVRKHPWYYKISVLADDKLISTCILCVSEPG